MSIRLTNSATRRKEDFVPLDPQNVRMYACGPTVYDRAHLGNARPAIVFDVLYRLLRHEYGPDHVTYVRNITDVDDKINARAAETGHEIADITAETAEWYFDDMAAIGNLMPDHTPRATEYIGQMIAMIDGLIDKGHAYAAEGHVLFRVRSYDAYGALSGRSVDDMRAGARVEVAPYKEDPIDFVLWKPSTDDLPGWESPWGRGRPGWHIECSAMARQLLGETFDIHAGGNDLMFPHHENEIAQSCCANGTERMARVWLHNEMLQVEGKKMSKSLGNFFTVRDLLDRGVPGEVIRFVMLSTHYRKPMDWTEEKAREALNEIKRWSRVIRNVDPGPIDKKIISYLSDDLNTHAALTRLGELYVNKDWSGLRSSAYFLGILNDEAQAKFEAEDDRLPKGALQRLIEMRKEARDRKEYKRSDLIRDELDKLDISLMDVPGGKVQPRTSVSTAVKWAKNTHPDETDVSAIVDLYEAWAAEKVMDSLP